jgi:hypothetical protein
MAKRLGPTRLRAITNKSPIRCSTSKQLIAETRAPIQMKEGRPARFDYEYERNGTAHLFMMFAPLEGWRHVKVTDRHTAVDYARLPREDSNLEMQRRIKPCPHPR